MPILITYTSGQQELVEGESWAKLDQDSPRMGTIVLKSIPEGHRIIVNKSAVAKVREIPQADFDKHKADQLRQADARQKADAERQAKVAQNAEWRKRSRLVRLFTRKPFPEVG